MTDHTELKRLAKAAPEGPWYQHGGIKQVLNHDCETVCETFEEDGDCPTARFIAAANPTAVLALISENERLSKQWGDRPAYRTPEYESKRDAMWRRAHMVATSKGYDHINMAISAAPSACTDCMGCGGEWQGEGAPNSVCETCNGSRGKALEAERDQLKADNERLRADYAGLARFNPEWDRVAAAQDLVREHMAMVVQLKAEIAGLKTGYEAYERVNAELKAEVEGIESSRAKLAGELSRLRAKHKDWSVGVALGQEEQS